jgi:hypothetical protein
MSEVIGRDAKTGRFLNGHKPGPGRPVGARSKLTTQFLLDLADTWQMHGKAALIACAIEDAPQFCKLVAGLLPRQAELSVEVDVEISKVLTEFRNITNGTRDVRVERLMRKLLKEGDDVIDAES